MRPHGFTLIALLVACCVGWTTHAQTPERMYRLGILTTGADFESFDPVTLPELARLGFVEGRNLIVEPRFAKGATERLSDFAKELVAARVDVIIAVSNLAISAVKGATRKIPIVMSFAGDDPVADGLVASFAHPGGNVTGLAMFATDGDAKRLELLKEAVPEARGIGFLTHRSVDPNRIARLEKVASRIGSELFIVKVTDRDDYAQAFATMASSGTQALALGSYPLFPRDAQELAALALDARLPTICEWREMAKAGCLLAYGPSLTEMRRRTAEYVAQLFRGAAPDELPIEGPTKFEFAVNLKTAKALGVNVPTSVLLRADEVIE